MNRSQIIECTDIKPEEDPMGKLAEMVAMTQYDDLPQSVIEQAKKAIFDAISVIIAGSNWQVVPDLANLVHSWGGKPESSVLVYGHKVSAPMAALVNGTMARSIDMGDVHEQGGHVTEWIVPTLLSILGISEKVISGKDFITAYVVAAELGIRNNACFNGTAHSAHGMPGEFNGPFYCTAATSKLLGLNTEQTWNALGMAYSVHGMSEMQKYAEGTQMVRLQHGFAAETSIKVVQLAKIGATGPKGVYMGVPGGFLRHIGFDDVDSSILTNNLGEEWLYEKGLSLKPYSSCKYTHSFISAITDLMVNNPIELSKIVNIHCIGSEGARMTIEPQKAKWNPTSAAEAMYSTPYAVATAAITGSVFLEAFSDLEINRLDKVELMKKITVAIDPTIENQFEGFTVQITLADGQLFSKTCEYVLGNTKNPMSWDDLKEKFWKCVPYSAVELSNDKMLTIIKLCESLDSVSNVDDLLNCLTP